MNQPSNPEEIDVLQFFSAIGKMFGNFFKSIKQFFVKLFYVFIESLLFIKKNIIYIIIGITLGLVLSYINKKPNDSYYAQAKLRTNYYVQLSLKEKIATINDLIEKEKYKELADFLQIDSTKAKHFKKVEIEPFYDDALMLDDYENYLSNKDTVVYKFFKFDDYKKHLKKNQELNKYWDVSFKADNPNVFKGFNQTFKNLFKDETTINQRKENYFNALEISRNKILQSINEIDSLRKVYNMALLESAKNQNGSSTKIILNPSEELGPEEGYNLFTERKQLFSDLIKINQKINKYNDAVVMLNKFPDYGVKERKIIKNYHIKYATFGFLLAIFMLLLKDFYNFLNRYEKQKN